MFHYYNLVYFFSIIYLQYYPKLSYIKYHKIIRARATYQLDIKCKTLHGLACALLIDKKLLRKSSRRKKLSQQIKKLVVVITSLWQFESIYQLSTALIFNIIAQLNKKKKMTVVILFKLSSRQLINTLKLLTKYTIRLVE